MPAPDADVVVLPTPVTSRGNGNNTKALGNSTGQLRIIKRSMLDMGLQAKTESIGQNGWASKLR